MIQDIINKKLEEAKQRNAERDRILTPLANDLIQRLREEAGDYFRITEKFPGDLFVEIGDACMVFVESIQTPDKFAVKVYVYAKGAIVVTSCTQGEGPVFPRNELIKLAIPKGSVDPDKLVEVFVEGFVDYLAEKVIKLNLSRHA